MPVQAYPLVREVGTPTTATASGTTCVIATGATLRRGDLLVIFDTRDYGTLAAMTAPVVTLQSNGAATGGTPVLLGSTGTTDNYGHIKVWGVEVTVPFAAMNITLNAVSGQDIAGHYWALQVDTYSLTQTAYRATAAAAQTVMTASTTAYTATIPQVAAGTAGNAISISCLAAQWPTAPTNVPTFNAPTSPMVERSEISAHKYIVSATYSQVTVQGNVALPSASTRTLTISQTPRSFCALTIAIYGVNNPIYDTRFTESSTEGLTGATDSYQSSTPTWLQGAAFDYGSPVRDMQLAADGSQTPGSGASANTSGAQRVEDYVRLRSLTGTNLVYKTAGDDVLASGSTGYFGLSIRLQAGFPVDPRTTDGKTAWQVMSQFKNDGAGSPPFELSIGEGMWYLDGNSGGWKIPICTAEEGQRYNIVMQITFTESNSTSRVSVWVNGTQWVNNVGPEQYKTVSATQPGFLYTSQGVYWKIGMYRQSDGVANRAFARAQYGAIAYDTTLASVTEWLNRATLDPDPAASYSYPLFFGEKVQDEFTTAIAAVWDEIIANNGTNAPAVVNGQLRVTAVAGNYYSGVRTFNKYTLKRSRFALRVSRVAPLGTSTNAETRITMNGVADGGARMVISYVAQRNVLRFANETGYYDANGIEIPYDPVAHQYWQFRELNGQVFYETSPSGVDGSWTTQRTITAPAYITYRPDERIVVENTRADGDTQYAEFDNVNVTPTLIQKGGTATVQQQVVVSASGVARRFGNAATVMGVSISPSASTKRGPNIASVAVGVAVSLPLAQKVRPGQVANVNLGVTWQVTTARKTAIAAMMIPVAVQYGATVGRKSVSRTAVVTVGVNVGVAFGQRQRRAQTTVAVACSVSTARGLHRGTAAISMGMTITTPTAFKTAWGTATTKLGVTMQVLVPAKRKLYPQIRENYQDPDEGMRYFLQDIRTKEFLHTEFPLEDAQITLALSGPDIIQGNFGFDIRDVEGVELDGWSQWIHAELDGQIATSGLLLPWTYEARTNQLEANGASVYPHGIPWSADKQYIQADPMSIMSDIWDHVQQGPMSNLGVRFIPTPTPVKLGTEEAEQVEFEASTGDTAENLDVKVTVKRESVTQGVWDKLLSMGYTQQGSTPLANAAAELRNRLNSGGNVYEDFTWTGMSANMGNNNDELCDRWYGRNGENKRNWPPTAAEKTQLISMLQGIINAGQGSLSVKKRDLITAQGGTPGTTATNTTGGNTEMVSFEAGGPYKLSWWEAPDCGGKIDELMKACPADYRESNYWDPVRGDVKHDIITGYPRLGRTLEEPAFVEDENLVDSIALEEEPEDFATEIWILGAGEGRDRVRGMASLTHAHRIRRVKVIEDKSITSVKVATALAKEMLSQSQKPVQVKTVLINLDHDYARLGSFAPGDDVRVKTHVRGYGDIDLYHRVEKMSWVPKSMLCAVDLIRSDTIRYGVSS